MYIGSRLATTD